MINHQPFQGNNQQYPNNYYQQQVQNGGFVSVPSIDTAQRYPVAPGNSVTFKIENEPIVCEKTQGFSVLEAPTFKVFDLVERKISQPIEKPTEEFRTEIDALNEHISILEKQLTELEDRIPEKKVVRKKGDAENE